MDNELGEAESALLFTHMGMCSECRQFFQLSMQIESELDALRVPEPISLPPVLPDKQKIEVAKWSFPSLMQRWGEKRIPLSFATAIVVFAMAGTFALSSLLIHPQSPITEIKERNVFIHMLPAEDVQPPAAANQKKSIQQGENQ
jgi:predicted anti-sigma-YlaC factor YlaD